MASRLKERILYERYSARLLAVCQRYTTDKDEAEDVLHDSFISIFQNLDKFEYRSESELYGWMRSIAVHRSIDLLRRKKNSPTRLDDDTDIADDGPQPDGNEIRKIPPGVLMKMISELPEGYRTIFNLFCIDGYSHSQIAGMLGIKERTSSSQYYRARAFLAKRINDYLKNEQE